LEYPAAVNALFSADLVLPCGVFNFGKPKTMGDWIVHVAGAIVALFLVWWMLRLYVL
jgi:hypothetical protein